MPTSLAEQAKALFNLDLTPAQVSQFETYAQELVVWNERVNLTAITAPESVAVRHFLDSLSIVQAVPMKAGLRVVDVGTGAGFPGLPLAMIYPDIHVVLMEATGKKINFLDHMAQTLGLKNVETLKARAEDAGHMPEHRARYDLVLARAVARLPSLLEYLLPLASVGGVCIAMKGKTAREEAEDSAKALSILGGRLRAIQQIQLPGVEDEHHLVIVEKTAVTPAAYPRKPGIPTQKPLI
jgi:16S rRNA (guanine527-N7)-methyltransferase